MNPLKSPVAFSGSLSQRGCPDNSGQQLEKVQKSSAYRFRSQDLLRQALTHKSSVSPENGDGLLSNERLEFLGMRCSTAWLPSTCTIPIPNGRRDSSLKSSRSSFRERSRRDRARIRYRAVHHFRRIRGEDRRQGPHVDSFEYLRSAAGRYSLTVGTSRRAGS